jgi:leishmanolysin-like peptidase
MRKLIYVVGLLGLTQAFEHKCNHDNEEHQEPTVENIEEDFNPEGNDHEGRTLASYSNFRAYGYYGRLSSASSSVRNYIQNQLVPPILDYFSDTLKIKYPTSGKFKVSSSSVCGFTTPSVLKTGVNADWIFVVQTDSSSSYVASTTTCSKASGTGRPIIGKTTISTKYVKPTTNVLEHEKSMICIMHEVIHALGFSKGLYGNWLNSSGKKLGNVVSYATLDGIKTSVISAEPLTSKLRSHFGCSSLKGAYMENTGSSGTAGSHFERRQFAYEAMTSGLIDQMQVSEITLALLESTGWYVPDYNNADPYHWGKGQGCSFLTGSCSSSKYDEFCSGSSRGCVQTGRGGGSCSTDSRSDNCKWVHPSKSYDCDNTGASSYARLPSLQSFGRSAGSKCFTGTLNSKSAGSQTSFCFKHSCSGSGSGAKLTLSVGSKSVVCSKKGNVSVSGYAGVIHCPDPVEYCATTGKKTCPRGCMGRGTCNNGVCVCKTGKGKDCAAP